MSERLVLGLLNNPCNSSLRVAFSLLNASTNLSETIEVKAEGSLDRMSPLALDMDPQNGIPDGVDRYPAYLKDYINGLQPVARLMGTTKIQGSRVTVQVLVLNPGAHLTTSDGVDVTWDPKLGLPVVFVLGDPSSPSPGAITERCAPWISAMVLLGRSMDNPCSPVPSPAGANCPAGPTKENSGYPFLPCESVNSHDEDGDGLINDGCPQVNETAESGAECGNNTSDDGEDAAVNDGCPPVGDVSEGSRVPGTCSGSDEGGCVMLQNPAAGTYEFTSVVSSFRDADGDGIDNPLDVCSVVYNPEWNPRAFDPVNDPDGDGLPTVCDPAPLVTSPMSPLTCPFGVLGPDDDEDCFPNRADNCPTTNQLAKPNDPPGPGNLPLLRDSDADGIGDACDPNLHAANGENIGYCLTYALGIGVEGGAIAGVRDDLLWPDCGQAVYSLPGFVQTPTPGPPSPAALAAALPPTGGSGGAPERSAGLLASLTAVAVAGVAFGVRLRRRT
jgi:hypothetical protein